MTSTATIEDSGKGNHSSPQKPATFLEAIRRRFGSFDNPFAPRQEPLIDVLSRINTTPVAIGPKDGTAKPKPLTFILSDPDLLMGPTNHYTASSLGPALMGNYDSSHARVNMISAPRINPFQVVNAKFVDCISSPTFVLIEFEKGNDIAVSLPDDAFMITRTKKSHSVMSDPKAADTPADLSISDKGVLPRQNRRFRRGMYKQGR